MRFIPISVATLQPTDAVEWDLYLLARGEQRPHLYRASKVPFGQEDLERLQQSGVHKLFIPNDQRDSYQSYLRETLVALGSAAQITLAAKAARLNDIVRSVLADALSSSDTSTVVQSAADCGRGVAQLIGDEQLPYGELARVLHHDFATFTHSANVSYYAVLLAQALGFSGRDLELIAAGGLLHDLGKLDVDDRILNKDGKLTESENREVRKHPAVGFRKLCRREDVTFGQLMMVYQHHERLDGGGYPVGVGGYGIHPWARLCAVVDVFEAITSYRPYRGPMSEEQALAVLDRQVDVAFDAEMVTCWKNLIRPSGES